MDIYKFSHSKNLKVIGRKYPQIITYESGYDYTAQYSISYLNNKGGWKQKGLKPPVFILSKSAKKTDLLSATGLTLYSFIWSIKFYEFINSFRLPPHITFPLNIQFKGKYLSNYILFHLCQTSEELIDFSKSKFCVAERIDKQFDIEIKSLHDYDEKKNNYESKSIFDPKIYAEKLEIRENTNFDLFGIGRLFSGIYVNEDLKLAIEKEGLTGIDFIPIEKLRIGGVF